MKITLQNGVATVTSENNDEALALVSLVLGEKKETKKEETKKVYNVARPCEICGKKYKGNKSMAMHKTMSHGIRSDKYEKNKAYYEKSKSKVKVGLLGSIKDLKNIDV